MKRNTLLEPRKPRALLSDDLHQITKERYLEVEEPYKDPRWGNGSRDPYKDRKNGR